MPDETGTTATPVSAGSPEDAKAEAEEAVRSAPVEAVKVLGEDEPECDYCEQAGPYLCQGCGDPVCESHSAATPEGGRICPDCEDTGDQCGLCLSDLPHARVPGESCPEHGHDFVPVEHPAAAIADWQDRLGCPEPGCDEGKWVS